MNRPPMNIAQMKQLKVLSEYFDNMKYRDNPHWVFVKCDTCNHTELWYTSLMVNRGSRFLMTGKCGHNIGIVNEPYQPIYRLRGTPKPQVSR